jgi:AcrR family transcriptional regulator
VRVTTETKAATRERILETAARLFAEESWERTTTREIAAAAGIANGTLFNYFLSREAIVAALIEEAMPLAAKEYKRRHSGDEPLEEDLFLFEWTTLKALRRHRALLAASLDTVFSPLAKPTPGSREDSGATIREKHLETAATILAAHGVPSPLSAILLQLYWTLHLGVLAFWAADPSPHQEDAMALLDRTSRLFAASLTSGANGANNGHPTERTTRRPPGR